MYKPKFKSVYYISSNDKKNILNLANELRYRFDSNYYQNSNDSNYYQNSNFIENAINEYFGNNIDLFTKKEIKRELQSYNSSGENILEKEKKKQKKMREKNEYSKLIRKKKYMEYKLKLDKLKKLGKINSSTYKHKLDYIKIKLGLADNYKSSNNELKSSSTVISEKKNATEKYLVEKSKQLNKTIENLKQQSMVILNNNIGRLIEQENNIINQRIREINQIVSNNSSINTNQKKKQKKYNEILNLLYISFEKLKKTLCSLIGKNYILTKSLENNNPSLFNETFDSYSKLKNKLEYYIYSYNEYKNHLLEFTENLKLKGGFVDNRLPTKRKLFFCDTNSSPKTSLPNKPKKSVSFKNNNSTGKVRTPVIKCKRSNAPFKIRNDQPIMLSTPLLTKTLKPINVSVISSVTPNKSLLTLNKSLLTPNKSLLTINKSVLTPNKSVRTPTKSVTDTSLSTSKMSSFFNSSKLNSTFILDSSKLDSSAFSNQLNQSVLLNVSNINKAYRVNSKDILRELSAENQEYQSTINQIDSEILQYIENSDQKDNFMEKFNECNQHCQNILNNYFSLNK
jgi:hypothetical protein